MCSIIREYNLKDADLQTSKYIKKRLKEIIETIKEPKLCLISNTKGDFLVFKQYKGIVEYRVKIDYREFNNLKDYLLN